MLKLFLMYAYIAAVFFPAYVLSSEEKLIDEGVEKCKDINATRKQVAFTLIVILSAFGWLFAPYKLTRVLVKKLRGIK